MKKPLLGGSVAVATLLSASLIFHAKPSVAETLALSSSESQTQQKSDVANTKTTGEATSAEPAETTAKSAPTVNATVEERKPSMPPAGVGGALPTENIAPVEPTIQFVATAYSLRGRTASGRYVSRGLIAADRRILPIGTRVRIEAGAYSGEYLVADTGGAVKGRKIDIWMPSTREAMRFGRRKIKLTVLTRVRPRTAKRAVKA